MEILGKELMDLTWATTKEIIRVHNEESGADDLMKVSIENATAYYIGSILITPITLPIVLGISNYFMPETSSRMAYLFLLALPAAGAWLSYKGYTSNGRIRLHLACLSANVLFAILLICGILWLGTAN